MGPRKVISKHANLLCENGSNYRFLIKTNDFWSNLTTAELKLKDQYLKRAMADGSDNCAN